MARLHRHYLPLDKTSKLTLLMVAFAVAFIGLSIWGFMLASRTMQ